MLQAVSFRLLFKLKSGQTTAQELKRAGSIVLQELELLHDSLLKVWDNAQGDRARAVLAAVLPAQVCLSCLCAGRYAHIQLF